MGWLFSFQILLGSTATKSNSGKGGRKRGDGFFSLAGPRVENRQSIQWADRLSHRAASYYGPIPGYWKSRNTGSNGTPFVIYQVNAYQL
ncbi:hypothetical protein MCOR07_000948 [Pyricularia oryzae]|nr:hypothetical protein MCOR34_007104 [Pyricularia oryzae]KAI6439023.1 hypothetical protein MCOR22_008298 [Pyricularia oryzae]KAI6490448.1 hypothetical protein MCOR13_008471 [Pyricularia oryzae]KAI6629247.1 hypothetical protein MCOR07_000948 [Pyricularia oryzae]